MKRKIAISTLAASMAVTAFAGIPLSSKGLAEKVGFQVNVASAAEIVIDSAFKAKIKTIHDALHKADDQHIQDVRDFRDALGALDEEDIEDVILPFWFKVVDQLELIEQEEVVAKKGLKAILTVVMGSYYDEDLKALQEIAVDPDVIAGLTLLEEKTGIEITVAEVVKFLDQSEGIVKNYVVAEQDNLLDLINANGREDIIRAIAPELRAADNNVSALLRFLDNNASEELNITTNDLVAAYNAFTELPGIEDTYEDATKALGTAYIRANTTALGSTNGLVRSYSALRVLGIDVPATQFGLTWTTSGNTLTQSTSNGNRVFTASGNGTSTITASIGNRVIFEETVTLTANTGGWVPGPGTPVTPPPGPGTETPPVDVPGVIGAVLDELDDILAGLEGASPSERAEIIAKAIDAAVVAIDKIANYNAASSVTVANGVATLNVSDADVLAIINGIRDIKAKLESLAPGSTNGLKPRAIAIHLGAISEDQVSVNISQALFTAARNAGLAGFEIVADRLSVTLPASNSFAGGAVNLSVERETPNGEPAVEGVRTASQIYSFDVTVGGNAVTTFDRQVILKIPVVNTDGLDEELLSLAKIVNGDLEFHGGFLRGGFIVEPRDSFSSYVIVENKVSFNDIGSVNAWAGRQIQVMAAKGAIQGRAAGQFVPRDNVTRAEFAKMLVRAMNLENNSATHSFSDVNSGDWFAPYVAAAADLGIINGRSATSFAPNALITRAEMATMLARTLSITHELEAISDVDGALAAFIDGASIHSTLRSGVALAASKELIIGYQGNFMPNDNATRAEAAVMVYRAFNFTE
ncbi:S-layer homology domain-containing protein [Paenibacillus daejeonensis]|uniref:S-layer homology domain-containing protein n=1 Tax=Paenibacillus daejeonensis TaxID=135193 RepID=UPI0003822FED|nr:S-layer homology domain-containing protein [Paenibacillus daejeonensis]